MEFIKNYENKNSLELYISEIENNLENKNYISALHLALSIPDMLGKVAFPELSSTRKRYIKWFDENVRNINFGYLYSKEPFDVGEGFPKMSGIVCYALRCSMFHEGANDIVDSNDTCLINEFVLSLTDEDFVSGNTAGIFPVRWNLDGTIDENKFLYVSCKGLCKELVAAAREYFKRNPNLVYPHIRINKYGGKSSL